MRWLFASVVLLACGDSKRAPAIDAAMIDAPIDALQQFACMKPSECNGNACCLICSPGGACASQCSAEDRCGTNLSMCDPNAAGPCLKADGMPGVCREQRFGPMQTGPFWVCGSM